MVRILINGHDLKFLKPLITHLEQSDDYQVVLDNVGGHQILNKENSRRLLKDADLIFCEWALGNSVWYSENKQKRQKLVIRLHHQEINLPFLNQIRWENVDQIVFICPENMEIFLRRFPGMTSRTSLIYNLIDCADLSRSKLPGAPFNLGFIGSSPKRKAPHLSLDLFERLHREDDRYVLYIKGKHPWEYPWLLQREDERQYYEMLYHRIEHSPYADSIIFDPHGNDMPEWFSKIGIILSTSDHEGSHQAVAEGMASGALPVIRNWAGADKLYPPAYVIRNITEATAMVHGWNRSEQVYRLSCEARDFARENFDIPVITRQYEELFRKLCSPGSRQTVFQAESAVSVAIPVVGLVCYLTPGNQSGYQIRVTEEANALCRQGLIPHIIIFLSKAKNPPVEELEPYCREMELKTGARIKLIRTDCYFHLHTSETLFREMDEPMLEYIASEGINILHAEALYAVWHCRRVAAKSDCRVVFDNHGILPEETMMHSGNPDWIRKLETAEKEALIASDMNILVSGAMQRYLQNKYNLTFNTGFTLPCCVHTHHFAMTREEREKVRMEKGFTGKFVLLYLGTMSIWQWPEALFTLFARIVRDIPSAFLYLLIPGYDHSIAKEYLEKNSIPADAYLLEEVPHQEAGKRIGAADTGILLRESHPVNFVSSPTKFGEYLAAGVPVILTEGIGDYSDMADRQKVGIRLQMKKATLRDDEYRRLKSFILDVNENRDVYSTRCNQVAARELDWDNFGENLVNRYKKLLNPKS